MDAEDGSLGLDKDIQIDDNSFMKMDVDAYIVDLTKDEEVQNNEILEMVRQQQKTDRNIAKLLDNTERLLKAEEEMQLKITNLKTQLQVNETGSFLVAR